MILFHDVLLIFESFFLIWVQLGEIGAQLGYQTVGLIDLGGVLPPDRGFFKKLGTICPHPHLSTKSVQTQKQIDYRGKWRL